VERCLQDIILPAALYRQQRDKSFIEAAMGQKFHRGSNGAKVSYRQVVIKIANG